MSKTKEKDAMDFKLSGERTVHSKARYATTSSEMRYKGKDYQINSVEIASDKVTIQTHAGQLELDPEEDIELHENVVKNLQTPATNSDNPGQAVR